MIVIVACIMLATLVALAAAIASNPLFRTLSAVMDNWADGVHGNTDQLR